LTPRKTDFFRLIVETRKGLDQRTDLSAIEKMRFDQFLKVLANAGSYGVYAQMDREDLPIEERVEVTLYGIDEPILARTNAPEKIGTFCFPPLAALITAAARLMLAMLERCVTDIGGHYAFCYTNSIAIVGTETGGVVECAGGNLLTPDGKPAICALTWPQVRAIVERFRALSPYDAKIIPGSILKIEPINFLDVSTGMKLRRITGENCTPGPTIPGAKQPAPFFATLVSSDWGGDACTAGTLSCCFSTISTWGLTRPTSRSSSV
jgi:hypothetical protein